MGGIFLWGGIFVVSIAVLVYFSDVFINAAEKVGIAFGIPAFIIGVTIVALGTSLPELVSSLIAVYEGSSEIVVANVVGSNITNICLILGIVAVLNRQIKVEFEILSIDLPLLIGSTLIMVFMVWDGVFSFFEALISVVGAGIYLFYALTVETSIVSHTQEVDQIEKKREKVGWKTWILLPVSGALIFAGAKYTVESIIELSAIIGVGADVIAVSAVALGTSLPELTVSLAAAKKGSAEIAVGNILGSNIFNAMAVMGIPGLLHNLIIPDSVIYFSLPLMVITTLVCFFMVQDKELSRWEGLLLLLFYAYFIGQLFITEFS